MLAACAVTVTGLVIVTPLVLVGWIAAPHTGSGLPGVLRTAAAIWLAAHHVGFSLRGAGRIGMLPLGLIVIPGALLWRAGRSMVRLAGVSRLADVGYAALTLAIPYALLCGGLAMLSRSAVAAPSVPEAVVAAFLLALTAGGLGGARALAPWGTLMGLLPPRSRSIVVATAGALTVLGVTGSALAGISLGAHLREFATLSSELQAGTVGSALLLLVQMAYLPNAIGWAVCFTLGPGFAFGTGTVVAPTGVALGPLPAFPMLAAIPTGSPAAIPGWVSMAVLAVPYFAGAFGGLLMVRVAPTPAIETAPLWGFACGAATGVVTGALAAFSGGALGSARLAAVGPSGWQAGLVATLEVGVAAAVSAGVVNWLRVRRDPGTAEVARSRGGRTPHATGGAAQVIGEPAGDDGHSLYLDPWAGGGTASADHGPEGYQPISPSALP